MIERLSNQPNRAITATVAAALSAAALAGCEASPPPQKPTAATAEYDAFGLPSQVNMLAERASRAQIDDRPAIFAAHIGSALFESAYPTSVEPSARAAVANQDQAPATSAAPRRFFFVSGIAGAKYSHMTAKAKAQATEIALLEYNTGKQLGLSDSQIGCEQNITLVESGNEVTARNPSGAYGLQQALPGNKMASAGADWRTDPSTQIKWGYNYEINRYGSPCGAWNYWEQNSSY